MAAGSLRKNQDGFPRLHPFRRICHHLRTGTDILPVQKQTVNLLHPEMKQRNFSQFLLGDYNKRPGQIRCSHDDIEDGTVISREHYAAPLRDILSPDHGDGTSRHCGYHAKSPADKRIGKTVCLVRRNFPEKQHNRHHRKRTQEEKNSGQNGQNRTKRHKNAPYIFISYSCPSA